MENPHKIHLDEARKLIIASQQFNNFNSPDNKRQLQNIIENLGYVQIDTISVVERSHHHILWSRMRSYSKSMLDELMEEDKSIFEYWSHAAAFLPVKDYRFSLIRKRNYGKKYKEWKKKNKKILKYVYDRIKREGPLQSRDFDDYRNKTTGWWDWKPSKDALDFLFHEGKLMIASRKGFQKVYDLTERVLPAYVNLKFPSEKEFYRYLILSSVNSNGLAGEKEITYLRTYDKKIFKVILNELLEEKKIIKLTLQNIEHDSFYTLPEKLNLLNNLKTDSSFHILSPFDNLIIQRKRIKTLFNFDYQIECYLPASKRKFGYFCMPILYGDNFIGKVDAKADRKNKEFRIIKIFWEDKVKLNKPMAINLTEKFNQLAKFSGCEKVINLKANLPK